MDYMVVISAVVLGLSVLATVAKFLDWFMHSDPRTMVRTTRWMLLLLLLACIPLLVMMIINQQWAAAMLIGAGMLVIPTLLSGAPCSRPCVRPSTTSGQSRGPSTWRSGAIRRTIPRPCAARRRSSRPMSARPP